MEQQTNQGQHGLVPLPADVPQDMGRRRRDGLEDRGTEGMRGWRNGGGGGGEEV